MRAVGSAAFDMIKEIRRQFREIPGLLEGTGKPDNARCVKIATTAALKRMILPGVLAVGAPPVIGFGLGAEALGGFSCRCSGWLCDAGADDGECWRCMG